MADLKEIREALYTLLSTNNTTLNVYRHMPDSIQYPAAAIWPSAADFTGSMQRGMDTWTIHILVMTGRLDYETNQDSLDDFLTGTGPSSVRRVIEDNPTLGLDDGTIAFVSGMGGYGGKFEFSQLNYTG